MSSILPLELQSVGFKVGERKLLYGLTTKLEQGRRTIVLGPNGAGKSLFLRLCHGLLSPSEGKIIWAGEANSQEIQRNQAMVFQRPVLLRRSALANVRYVLSLRGVARSKRQAQALDALARFGLEDLANRSARVLSGGEQQRLALARAWAVRPQVLFLDEPTSALDPAATLAVEIAVHDFHSNGTKIIMTTHDLGQARRLADDVLFLSRGRLLEQASAESFFHTPVSPQARAFLSGELMC